MASRNTLSVLRKFLLRIKFKHLRPKMNKHKIENNICNFFFKKASKTLSSVSGYVNQTNNEGGTALHTACMRGHLKVADLLLRHGADRDALNWVACTSPLHYAAKSGHAELVELLILYGAIIDGRDGNLRTPLHRYGFNRNVLFYYMDVLI